MFLCIFILGSLDFFIFGILKLIEIFIELGDFIEKRFVFNIILLNSF